MKNGLAAAIVDGAMPSDDPKTLDPNAAAVGPSDAPPTDGADEDISIVAQDMMDAFKAGDTGALVAALGAFKASILAGDTDTEDPLKQ